MSQKRKLHWTTPGLVATDDSVRTLEQAELHAVFQPIVALRDGRTIAHEALARCQRSQFSSPVALFEQAAREEACGRLGRLVRNVIFEHCEQKPIFVNLHPQELHQRWLVQPTDPIFLHDAPVFLEITEAAALRYFGICLSVLSEVCARCNARLVVDDFGAGFSDMDRVLKLKPDIVKLDMSLIRDLDEDVAQQRYLAGIVERCHELGAQVVAEGIEGIAELHAVRDLGIEYGQGYLFGRPAAHLDRGLWPLEGAWEERDDAPTFDGDRARSETVRRPSAAPRSEAPAA